MARKRTRHTLDLLEEALDRIGLGRDAVSVERLCERLGLPDYDGFAEDADIARAAREMRSGAAFALQGAGRVSKAVSGLRYDLGVDGALTWTLRVRLPVSDCGRIAVRVSVPADARMLQVLARMADRNDPFHGLDSLRSAADSLSARTRDDARRSIGRIRDQLAEDLVGMGADAAAYAGHVERSVSSWLLAAGPNLPRQLSERLKGVREHARRQALADSRLRRMRDTAGFGSYIDKFLEARTLRRRIVFHMGPTNSGKTYAALQMLREAPLGTYLAPLRLLALENFEALRDMGLRAGMVTGEEVLGEADPTHVSRTIETADLSRLVDVAVIDEIQMLSDPDRGWAWTNALFGIPARTLVLCGSDDALPYVRRAAEAAGESLEVVRFVRKTPLVLVDRAVPLEAVEAGDAVVAFSRRAVHEQREILVGLGHVVATIYGALSPEVRRAEAARFRGGEADVLVTTDAIGMGLNLGPLRRVVFSSVRKWDGVRDRPLANPEIRQIAGRAGRFGHQECGYVAVTEDTALEAVRDALSGAPALPAEDMRFYVRPDIRAIRAAAREMGTERLSDVLEYFARATFYEGSPFQPCAMEDTLEVARIVDRVDLPIDERFAFSICPVDRRDEVSMDVLRRWTEIRFKGAAAPVPLLPAGGELVDQERAVRIAGAYLWLSRRYPETFSRTEETRRMRSLANDAIEAHLRATASRRAKRRVTAARRDEPAAVD